MNPSQFIESIYVGDRGCTAIEIDGNRSQLRIHVDELSRVRDPSGKWNFYTDEDIRNAILVFDGVENLVIRSPEGLPCDFINDLEVLASSDETTTVRILVGCTGSSTGAEAVFDVTFRSIYIVDPLRPDEAIST